MGVNFFWLEKTPPGQLVSKRKERDWKSFSILWNVWRKQQTKRKIPGLSLTFSSFFREKRGKFMLSWRKFMTITWPVFSLFSLSRSLAFLIYFTFSNLLFFSTAAATSASSLSLVHSFLLTFLHSITFTSIFHSTTNNKQSSSEK